MTTNDWNNLDVIHTRKILYAVRDYYTTLAPTHFVNINPRIATSDLVAIERMVRCGLSRVIDRLPAQKAPKVRFVLLREINGARQPHYHGWLAAEDALHLPMDTCADRWIRTGMHNFAKQKFGLENPPMANLEICRIGEHPLGSCRPTKRTEETAREYPLKLRTALAKGDDVIWM
jgi:hypothetical protein